MKVLRLALLLACVGVARGQQGPIEPAWVYVSPVKWVHARTGSAVVAVLFPEGRYVEVLALLIRDDKTKRVTFSQGDGMLIREGTWSRTDDARIRIHSRNVSSDSGSFSEDNCALEGQSKTHLAGVIHCRRISVSPLTLNLNMEQLGAYVRQEAAK